MKAFKQEKDLLLLLLIAVLIGMNSPDGNGFSLKNDFSTGQRPESNSLGQRPREIVIISPLIIGRVATNNERELERYLKTQGNALGCCYQAFSLFISCLSDLHGRLKSRSHF
ncbi:hypothetical protein [Marinilabilia salmonicolor]|uniref:hypothetical protein n=1 Tax=Marinilabilia salmonicolor TaxID=989 RepID=UPI000D04BE43|nr:hypothetical protein [Marinilabilia salmonicolor]